MKPHQCSPFRPSTIIPSIIALSFWSITGTLHAINRTWVGTTNEWSTTSNWNPAALPGASDALTFNDTATGTSVTKTTTGSGSSASLNFSGTKSFTFTDFAGAGVYASASGPVSSNGSGSHTIPYLRLNYSSNANVTLTNNSSGLLTINKVMRDSSGKTGDIIITGTGNFVVDTFRRNGSDVDNGLQKSGAGTLTITNYMSSFTGASVRGLYGKVSITGGTVKITSGDQRSLGQPQSADASWLTLDGGTLQASTSDLNINNANTGIALGANGGTFNVDASRTLSIGGGSATNIISGVGALTKSGDGSLTLSGANTYSGSTHVNAGTLTLNQASLNDAASVDVATAATLVLNFTGIDNIGTFYIDGVAQSSGTWGAIGSGADHESSRITGTGILKVIPTEFTWTDIGGDEKWSTATNWDVNIVPTTGTLVHFPNTVETSILNDLPTGTSLGTLRFEADAPAYTISGTNTLGISLGIDNLSNNIQTLEFPIEIFSNAQFKTTSSVLALNGNLSGNFGISKLGNGELTLSGTSTYTGNTTVNGGVLTALSANAIPSTTSFAFTNTTGTAALDITGINQTLAGMTFGTQTSGSNTVSFYGDSSSALTTSPATLSFAPLNSASNLTVNMSSLGSFTYNNPSGTFNVNGNTAAASSGGHFTSVTLASTSNSITALNLNIGNTGSSTGVPTSTLALGDTASLNVSNIGIGNSGSRANGNLTAGVGTLTVRGTDGTSPALLTIGVSDSFSATDTTTSVFDASAGTLDALFSNVLLGKDGAGGSARGVTINARLKMGAGNMSAATMTLGNLTGAYTGAGSYGINSLLELNGTGTANITNLTLAQNAASTSPATFVLNSQVTVAGGATLNATTIQQGTVTGVTTLTTKINWSHGTIGNISGADLAVSGVAIELGSTDSHTFNVTSGQTATVSSIVSSLSGSTPLTKTGAGTLTLSGANTYAGTTTVSGGTLETTTPYLDDASSVEIASGAVLNLNFSGTDIVSALTLDGVLQTAAPTTTYGATGSGAMVIDDVHFSGTGKLQVGVITDPYVSWIASFGLTGGDAAKTADPDGDGQNNVLEFALDGNPASGTNTGKVVSKIDADHLTLTLPVRTGATFSGTGPLTSATIDGLIYTIEGDNDLSGFTTGVEEVSTLASGLPSLTSGWTYRTFRLTAAVSSASKGFLRAGVDAAP